MPEISDEREGFDDFIEGKDLWSRWEAARRLMAARQMQSAASEASFAQSFRDLGNVAVGGHGLEKLLAIALIVRISDLVKGDLRKDAVDILSEALTGPIEGFWTISEAKDIPVTGKPSEIRENIASALSHASGDWVVPYVVEALAREEKSARCRLELVRQLARSEKRFTRWLQMLSDFAWDDVLGGEGPERIRRLGDLAIALAAGLRERDVVVDENTGPVLAAMMQQIVLGAQRVQRSQKDQSALAVIQLLDEILATDFALIADADAYAALAVIVRWWSPSAYPQSIDEGLRNVVRKLVGAIRLRARLGQKSESLALRLRQALGAGGSTSGELVRIAETETGLSPDIDDWLRGREREDSATASAISSLLSEATPPTMIESVAALLLELIEVEEADLAKPEAEVFRSHVERIRGRILALAAELKLAAEGVQGEAVEFNPAAHRTISGTVPPDPIVRVKRPMIVRRRDDGSQDIIERAIVE